METLAQVSGPYVSLQVVSFAGRCVEWVGSVEPESNRIRYDALQQRCTLNRIARWLEVHWRETAHITWRHTMSSFAVVKSAVVLP